LQHPGGWPPASSGAWFQSLSGFFRPCNIQINGPREAGKSVSIPVGFFQALQPKREAMRHGPEPEFQSLSGFFRPCNSITPFSSEKSGFVSIPVGFFQALQLSGSSMNTGEPKRFQSLSGFFRPCNVDEVAGAYAAGKFQSLSGFFRPCNEVIRKCH